MNKFIRLLPIRYAVRNLTRDLPRLGQTVGGSALVVFLLMSASAINTGMKNVLAASGRPGNVILLGTGSEESIQRSEIPDSAAAIAATAIPGVYQILGQAAVSPEIHHMTEVTAQGQSKSKALVRGITPVALMVHPEVRVLEGGFPRTGQLMAGRLAARALGLPPEAVAPGARLEVEGQVFTVSGRFAAPGTVMESELWMPLGDLRTLAQRDTLSCLVLRMTSADGFDDADLFTKQRLDLELAALRESDYYGKLNVFYQPIRTMTWVTALLIAAGAIFGGLNTLYAAFAPRLRECGTLQAIGFSRPALLVSFVQESCLACALGTLLGVGLAIFCLDGFSVPFAIGSFTLRMEPGVVGLGLMGGLLLGLLGAFPAAIRCLRPSLPSALRG